MLAAVVLAFAFAPLSHSPQRPRPVDISKAFFVGDMVHLVPQQELPFQPRQTATPVLDEPGSRLYVGTNDGYVRCRFHGRTVWTWHAGGSVLAAPLLDRDTLYVSAADGRLSALNRITGDVRWVAELREELTTTPTLAGGNLYVMSSEESITAVDADTGKSVWKFHRDPPGGFTIRGNARPIVAHGSVFAGFADGSVAALGPSDGVAKWVRAVSGTGDYLDVDDLAVPEADDRIYAASSKVGVVALDVATGNPVWTAPLPGANHLVVDGPRVYATGKSMLIAVARADGKPLWKMSLGNDHYATASAVTGGLILFAIERGPLVAVDALTGRMRGAFNPGSGFSAGPLVIPGAAFAISNAGVLFSLGLVP
ncbi:MAG TPA: PQQ-binding-like beta-propeller repeat protein [Myxococcales bacterium]|nr:PQQ-binding-like beta-propeller repeat protein [Myxococcales bacterium]